MNEGIPEPEVTDGEGVRRAMEWYLCRVPNRHGPNQRCEMGGAMRTLVTAFAAAALVGCSIFGGAGGPDPLAGWGGLWAGEYESSTGGYGPLEVELSVDTAGLAAGVTRFDQGYGMEQHRLTSLYLTQDSIKAEFSFEGMLARIRGAREAEEARGTFVLEAPGSGVMDSGSWRLTRRPPEG